ncbi:AurF N-oxygenase family protein [Ilumatobacter sp.]|uniref:AurF N-oxygenase family protein n=1 Tax=Ilumatobacter sp. TaxID=1967498 RepID=UPI003C3CA6AE
MTTTLATPQAAPSEPSVAAPVPTPRTTLRAEQLIAASDRQSHDPFRDITWDVPIDDSAFHLPPELLALYGTPEWDAMTETERITYSRHEAAATYSAGIWFENALMQVVLRHLTEIDVTDPIHRYLLIEVADECRHSAMFGEFVRRAGTPSYAPHRPVMLDETSSGRVLSYLLILAIEELLDHVNRATMRDDRLHTVSRQIARLHVLEEARHVSFAKSYLSEVWPKLDTADHAIVRDAAPILVAEVVSISLNPGVFEHLGIVGGADVAAANPRYRANIVSGLGKLTTFLADVGIIEETDDRWSDLGLVAM